MLSRKFWLLVMALSLAVAPRLVFGSDTPDDESKIVEVPIESEPGLKPFVERYLAAVNARDAKAIAAMSHPRDLRALKAFVAHPPADYRGSTLKEMLLSDRPVPKNHTRFVVKRYLPGSPPPEDGLLRWPVRPTYTVEFSYETAPHHETWVTVAFVQERDRWYLLGGVPDPGILKNLGAR